jgi:hypothetical protein
MTKINKILEILSPSPTKINLDKNEDCEPIFKSNKKTLPDITESSSYDYCLNNIDFENSEIISKNDPPLEIQKKIENLGYTILRQLAQTGRFEIQNSAWPSECKDIKISVESENGLIFTNDEYEGLNCENCKEKVKIIIEYTYNGERFSTEVISPLKDVANVYKPEKKKLPNVSEYSYVQNTKNDIEEYRANKFSKNEREAYNDMKKIAKLYLKYYLDTSENKPSFTFKGVPVGVSNINFKIIEENSNSNYKIASKSFADKNFNKEDAQKQGVLVSYVYNGKKFHICLMVNTDE